MNKKYLHNKKGSHVGVILSFVIFVTFLVFLYTTIEPAIKVQKEKDSLLDFVETEIINNVTRRVVTSFIEVYDTASSGCIKIEPVSGVDSSYVIVKNSTGKLLDSYGWDGSFVYASRGGDSLLKMFFLDKDKNTEPPEGECENLENLEEGIDYNITYTRTNQHIYESAIIHIIDQYNTGDVDSLKEYFNIPTGSEFGLAFKNYEGGGNSTNEANISSNVYSKEINIEYLDKHAEEKSGSLSVRVW